MLAACGDPAATTPSADTDTDGSDSGSVDTGSVPDSTDDGLDDALTDEGLDSDSESSGTDGPVDDPGDPFDLPPPLPTIPDATLADLATQIDAVLTAVGIASTTQSVLIVDAETGQQVYAKNPDLLLKPASNTKMFTTAVAMETLGDDHRLPTVVRVDAPMDDTGAVAGDLHVVLHHDFTWSPFFGGIASNTVLGRIAEDLYDLGLRTVSGALVVHGEAVYNGQQFSTYNAASHRSAAANTLASALNAADVVVQGGTETVADFEQPGELLYTWHSPPLSVGAAPTNTESHNEFADVLARHVGFELEGQSSYDAEETALLSWLESIPTPTQGLSINDGSGLSHDNRVSAQTIVDLIGFMIAQPSGPAWLSTMAVAGHRGTLQNRMTGPDTSGRVWGKTGTLTGVIATSGVLFNRYDGRRYLVGMLMNEVASNSAARTAQNSVFEIVAGDHYAAPRPDAPVLQSVHSAVSDVVEIEWSAVEGAEGYLVWLSPDGRTWDRDDARLVDTNSHRAGDIGFGPDVYVRISAVGSQGESDPSDVYGSVATDGAATVLVVDGFDRWQREPMSDNPRGRAHDFVVNYGTAFEGAVQWDTADNDAVGDTVELTDYDAVFWLLGEESTEDETFSAAEQTAVSGYLDAGGNLFVSGAEIGWDLVANGDPMDAEFYGSALHADYIADESGSWIVDGSGGPLANVGPMGVLTPAAMQVDFADEIAPTPDAEAVARYYAGFGGTAGVAHDGGHRLIYLAVPFSAIDSPDTRATVMAAALDFFAD